MLLSFLIFILPVIGLITAAVYFPFFAHFRRLGKRSLLFHLPRFALTGFFLCLIYLTILWYYPDITFHPDFYFLNLRPFVWVTEVYAMGPVKMVQQLILNIAMFLPYGFLLPITAKSLRRGWKTALAVLAITLAVETLQYFMGRSADIDDVIMNFLGGILGYWLFLGLNRTFGEKAWWQAMTGR